jgi:hypothetical protein
MRATTFRDRIHLRGLAGSVGILGWFGIPLAGIVGCSPATPPVAPAKPVAAAHADHDHDHGKDDSHGLVKKAGDDHDDHGDHDHAHPATLAAGVLELEAMWGKVKESLKAGDRDKADEKVHAVGHLLEDFEGLLAKEKAEAQEAGKKATQEVFDCFDKLDEAFHGDEDDLKKLDLNALGERLEAAIKTLKGLTTGSEK